MLHQGMEQRKDWALEGKLGPQRGAETVADSAAMSDPSCWLGQPDIYLLISVSAQKQAVIQGDPLVL